jgi:mono/diheme cytochrome c family protein
MIHSGQCSRGKTPGVVAIAATYVYFLLYAQFGFVSYLKQFHADPVFTEKCMGLMGMGGLLFSFATAILLRQRTSRSMLAVSFAGCAAAALLTLTNSALLTFYAAAFFIGGFTGMLTVTLAAGLRNWIPGKRFGFHVGLGTGLAYLICNIPAVFDASPAMQTVFSALICLPGLAIALRPARLVESPDNWKPILPEQQFRGIGFVAIVLMFLALVWLDSTAFATIQLSEHLRSRTWGSSGMKMELGIFHALAAVAAGILIDRGWMKSLLAITFGLFSVAFMLLQIDSLASGLSGPLYAFGISVYSTSLVAFPSLHADKPGLVPMRWRAAILYAVAGWIGSGLGVGLAQHLHAIPMSLLLIAGMIIFPGLILPITPNRINNLRRYAPLALVGIGGGIFFMYTSGNSSLSPLEPSIEYGREVYKQEGCINCHSQYLRPQSPDIVMWGPYRGIDRNERPPMVGNRRQGPDLMNAGLRRTDVWHRQHLINPPSLSPGSKMPSYAHLFLDNDLRGPSLVKFLSSLGVSNVLARLEINQRWTPKPERAEPSLANGQRLFARNCSMCHGIEGRGDGPLASLFFRPAMALTKGPFVYVPRELDKEAESVALSRVVKFGLPGLPMPGHEYFDDQEILDVVAYVRTLADSGVGAP